MTTDNLAAGGDMTTPQLAVEGQLMGFEWGPPGAATITVKLPGYAGPIIPLGRVRVVFPPDEASNAAPESTE